MRKPNFGKPRSANPAVSSLSKRLTDPVVPKSAPPTAKRLRPQVNKPTGSREAHKK